VADIFPPRRDEPLINEFGLPTLRFAEYLEGVSAVASSDQSSGSESTVPLSYQLSQQIGTGDPLTSDETGFTVDSTLLSVDMTEA